MTGCGGEHPESGPLHQQPGAGRADEHAHSHGVTANADSRYIAVALGLIAVHVWLITSGFPALSAHVLVQRPADCHQVRRDLEQLLGGRFGLDHTTLQVDHAPDELLTIKAEPRS